MMASRCFFRRRASSVWLLRCDLQDGAGLLGRLVNAGHDKPAPGLGVQVGLRGGLKDGGGAVDGVDLGG